MPRHCLTFYCFFFFLGGQDGIVPPSTSVMYHERLVEEGAATNRIVERGPHEWIPSSPADVLAWVQQHS